MTLGHIFAILEIDESDICRAPKRSRYFKLWQDRAISSTALSVMLQNWRLRYWISEYDHAIMHIDLSLRAFIL